MLSSRSEHCCTAFFKLCCVWVVLHWLLKLFLRAALSFTFMKIKSARGLFMDWAPFAVFQCPISRELWFFFFIFRSFWPTRKAFPPLTGFCQGRWPAMSLTMMRAILKPGSSAMLGGYFFFLKHLQFKKSGASRTANYCCAFVLWSVDWKSEVRCDPAVVLVLFWTL